MEVLQQLAAVAQPREDRELALERILPEQVKLCQLTDSRTKPFHEPKVEIEGGDIIGLARLPVGVGHGQLWS